VSNIWSTIHDDDLNYLDKTVGFLQGEFCPEGMDPIWSSQYFKWKLGSSNPAGKGYLSLALMDNKVVGSVSITKKRLLIDGCEYIGGEIGDSYSSAAVRRRCRPEKLSELNLNPKSYINKSVFGRLATEIRARAEQDGVNIIYGTPNNKAYPGWIKRLDYFDFKNSEIRSYSRPTTKFIIGKFPFLSYIRLILRGMEISTIGLYKIFYEQIKCRGLRFEVGIPTEIELNNLWKKLKPQKGFSLVRDALYWRHRYFEHPLVKYIFFKIIKNEKVIGVVVTRMHYIGTNKKVVSISEWMLNEKINFGYVLSNIVFYFKRDDIDVFNLWLSASDSEAKKTGINYFFSKRRIPIILSNTSQSKKIENISSHIDFYLGCSDAI